MGHRKKQLEQCQRQRERLGTVWKMELNEGQVWKHRAKEASTALMELLKVTGGQSDVANSEGGTSGRFCGSWFGHVDANVALRGEMARQHG